jgi:hypothetical protein
MNMVKWCSIDYLTCITSGYIPSQYCDSYVDISTSDDLIEYLMSAPDIHQDANRLSTMNATHASHEGHTNISLPPRNCRTYTKHSQSHLIQKINPSTNTHVAKIKDNLPDQPGRTPANALQGDQANPRQVIQSRRVIGRDLQGQQPYHPDLDTNSNPPRADRASSLEYLTDSSHTPNLPSLPLFHPLTQNIHHPQPPSTSTPCK